MCWITWGIFRNKELDVVHTCMTDMSAAIAHRWPDAQWYTIFASWDIWISSENEPLHIWLAQLRLAIIDLSPAGEQPMYYHKDVGAFSKWYNAQYIDTHASQSLRIVFNGEIYNYQEIKDTLLSAGYIFATKSDTEVILASYLAYGESCVQRFNGMRAFTLYDPHQSKVFCSRDRLGKKPFYYAFSEHGFLFSSELKWILASNLLPARTHEHLDKEALDLYFNLGYIPSPRSIYKDIKKLPARHTLTISLPTLTHTISSYYDLPAYAPEYNKQELIAEWKELLADAVNIRMFTSDVPVGAFLSWWLDSSSIVGEMTKRVDKEKLNTFSVGFEWTYDESEYITIVKDAFGTTHHHVYFTQKDFDSLLSDIPYFFDEPLGDPSVFPTYMVSQLAKKDVTVSLSGDGGDEMFGWYPLHQAAYYIGLFRSTPRFLRRLLLAITRLFPSSSSPFSRMGKIAEACRLSLAPKEQFFAKLLSDVIYRSPTYITRTTDRLRELLALNGWAFAQSIIDFDLFYNTLADNFLTKTDRASMAHALEVRAPFLDWRFVAFTRKIPISWKVNFSQTKVLLREIIKDIVPETIVRRGKQGFTPPIEKRILQDKYIQEITQGIEDLFKEWILSPERYTFLCEKVLTSHEQSFNVYKIRVFFFLLRYKKRIAS